ncbi:MAG: hypothetical protein PHQ81_03165 [Methanofollis sp.]|nr:hypothetical protein [Methanofollis sp.]
MTIKRVLPSSTYRVAGGSGGGKPPAREIHQEDFYNADIVRSREVLWVVLSGGGSVGLEEQDIRKIKDLPPKKCGAFSVHDKIFSYFFCQENF